MTAAAYTYFSEGSRKGDIGIYDIYIYIYTCVYLIYIYISFSATFTEIESLKHSPQLNIS